MLSMLLLQRAKQESALHHKPQSLFGSVIINAGSLDVYFATFPRRSATFIYTVLILTGLLFYGIIISQTSKRTQYMDIKMELTHFICA